MVILEQLVYFGYGGVVYLLQLADLLLEHFPLMAPNFVLIDDVNGPHESGLDVDDLTELVKLILLQTGRQHLVLRLNAALYLSDEVFLLELHFCLPVHYFYGGLVGCIRSYLIAHFE